MNLSVLNTVAEVELVYKSKVKASERPWIRSSKEDYDLIQAALANPVKSLSE